MANRIPRTYKEAYQLLDKRIKEIEQVRIAQNDSVHDLHFSLGLWVRNNWINSSKYLCDESKRKNFVILNADIESSDLLKRYQKYLQKKYDIYPQTKNYNLWKKLDSEWIEKCKTTPPDSYDQIVLRYEKVYRNSVYVALRIYGSWVLETAEYKVPIKDLQTDINMYINLLERILRHQIDPSTSDSPIDWHPDMAYALRQEDMPNMIDGTFTCYDVWEHKMVFKAYVNTIDMIRDIYTDIKRFKNRHPRCKAIQQLNVHSDMIESFFAEKMPDLSL